LLRDISLLSALLKASNRLAEAEPLMRRAFLICAILARKGLQHPSLNEAVENYFELLKCMGLSEREIRANPVDIVSIR
jgi:hypothetical protein